MPPGFLFHSLRAFRRGFQRDRLEWTELDLVLDLRDEVIHGPLVGVARTGAQPRGQTEREVCRTTLGWPLVLWE